MSVRRIRRIERCFNPTDLVWLTFDDGGTPAQVIRILKTLRRNDVRGRFFFTGAWAERYPTLLRRIKRQDHLVANHSYSHPALSREPGAFTHRLQSLAAKRGYRLCRWTVDTYDWQGTSTAQMVERIRTGDELTPPIASGGNILMHGTAPHTSFGLQRIIDAVRAEGLTLDPLPPRP